MLRKNSITLSLALSFAAVISIGSLNSCGGSKDTDQSSDSTQVADESTSSSSVTGAKKYEIKSGIVTYKPIEIMKGVKTQEVLYFDDYGKREARITTSETNIMGISNKEKAANITDGEYNITYSLEKIENGKNVTEKVAKKMKLSASMIASLGMAAMFSDVQKLKDQYDYKEEGTETVAGLSCKKFSLKMDKSKDERYTFVTYKNILMKSEMMGIKIEVEKIEENVTVPADKFAIPGGYKVEEVSMDDVMSGK